MKLWWLQSVAGEISIDIIYPIYRSVFIDRIPFGGYGNFFI